MSRRLASNALMFGGPLVAIIAAFIVGMIEVNRGVSTACDIDCQQRMVVEASHRHLIVLALLGLAVVCAIAGYVIRPSVRDA